MNLPSVYPLDHSLMPISLFAQEVRLEPAQPGELRPGDLAMVRGRDGHLRAHLVLGRAPWASAPLLGAVDPAVVPVGRIVALRVGRRELEVTRPFRLLFRLLRILGRLVVLTRVVPMLRVGRELWGASPLGRAIRRLRLCPFTARRLTPEDSPALEAFARRELPVSAAFFLERLKSRWQEPRSLAVGAFDRRGRLQGFMYVDEFRHEGIEVEGAWIRQLRVATGARYLGVAKAMADAAFAAGQANFERVWADLAPGNAPILRLMRRLGFEPASAEETSAFNQACERAGHPGGWEVWRLDVRRARR